MNSTRPRRLPGGPKRDRTAYRQARPTLYFVPISTTQARSFVTRHGHAAPPCAARFALAAAGDHGLVVGVVVVGTDHDDRHALRVTGCATNGTPGVTTTLYAAAARVTRALGYSKLVPAPQHALSEKSYNAGGNASTGSSINMSTQSTSR